MAKRFIDSEIWKKSWFRKLKPKYKCFFVYLFTDCNNAGIWEKDIETAEHFIGAKLGLDKLLDIFDSHIIEVETNKWFLVDFIDFQYNCKLKELNPKNKAHLSVINKLKKYNIKYDIKPLVSPLEGHKDKNKDKDKDIDKDIELDKEKDKDIKRNVIFFLEYFNSKNNVKLKQTDDRKELVKKKLKEGYTLEQLKTCVDNFIQDDWEERPKYIDVIYCIGKQRGKPDNLEKWLNWVKPNPLNLLKPGDLHDKR